VEVDSLSKETQVFAKGFMVWMIQEREFISLLFTISKKDFKLCSLYQDIYVVFGFL
jgi:hypothetical protein